MPILTATKSRSQTDEERRKRELALLLLIALLARDLDRTAAQTANGTITAAAGYEAVYQALYQAHSKAAILGVQQAAGGAAPVTLLQQFNFRVAAQATESQRTFLRGFITDLEAGRYDAKRSGGEGVQARKRRCALYGQRLNGTANQAWLYGMLAKGELVLWRLGKVDRDRHCRDCIMEAEQGWRRADQFTRVPGDGRTKCIVNCACSLVSESGNEAFRLVRE